MMKREREREKDRWMERKRDVGEIEGIHHLLVFCFGITLIGLSHSLIHMFRTETGFKTVCSSVQLSHSDGLGAVGTRYK